MRKLCRVLFSRYTLCALIILLEVLLTVFIVVSGATSFIIVSVVSAVASLVAFFSILLKDTTPEYKITWIVLILMLPPFGALIYALFYQRKMSRREALLVRGAMRELQAHGMPERELSDIACDSYAAAGKARAIINDDPLAMIYRNTSSRYFSSGEELFEALLCDISGAKKYIFLEYFIIEDGALWGRIHSVLVEKARAGVDVRLLYDDVGCMKTLPAYYELELRKEGIRAYRFARVNPKVSAVHHNRDHRKICIVDGKCAYTGGVNIADEYTNEKTRFGYWKDGGVRVEGEAVIGFLKLFLSNFDFTSRTISDYHAILSEVKPADEPDGGFYLPFGSGPAPIYRRPAGKNAFLNLINQAQRYVNITTPYLIIDYELTEALRCAALRGVEVEIITPGIPDKKLVNVMTRSAYPFLIETGVRIYEYTPGFIHEKTVVVDDLFAVIGTINFDYRSLVHHFENAVWMYKTPTVAAAREDFLKTRECSRIMDGRRARLTFFERTLRAVIKLFAPLL